MNHQGSHTAKDLMITPFKAPIQNKKIKLMQNIAQALDLMMDRSIMDHLIYRINTQYHQSKN